MYVNILKSKTHYFVCLDCLVPSRITGDSGNLTKIEGQGVTLECQANGNPTPNITWTRLSDNSVFNGTLANISRQDKEGYRCTAFNGVGSPATKDIFITVKCEC